MFDLDMWSKHRNKSGTLANAARQVFYLGFSYAEAMRAFEANYLAEALLRHEGSVRGTVREIGMSQATVNRRIKFLGIDVRRMGRSVKAAK